MAPSWRGVVFRRGVFGLLSSWWVHGHRVEEEEEVVMVEEEEQEEEVVMVMEEERELRNHSNVGN